MIDLDQTLDERLDLVAADGGERLEAVGGEELEGGDAAEVSPVVTIGGPGEAGVVVGHDSPRHQARAVGEDDVVFGEAFLGGRGGRDDDGGTGAESEEENGAVAVGNSGESLVERSLEEVEVADDGEGEERGWREVLNPVEQVGGEDM